MSKLIDYVAAASGYDSAGLPAASTQFTFGNAPIMMAETERVEDVTTITSVCHSDAIVDLKIVDNIAMLSFDFSMENETFLQLYEELDMYQNLSEHVAQTLSVFSQELKEATQNEDEEAIEKTELQLRALSIPFFNVTIIPMEYAGTVHISFDGEPKFILYTTKKVNESTYTLTLIYDAAELFCEDEQGVFYEDSEADIQAQQEEEFFAREERKFEEEMYQAQYGGYTQGYEQDEQPVDKKLKGVRFK